MNKKKKKKIKRVDKKDLKKIKGGVDIIECHGDHVGMLKDPNVEKVAKNLRLAIDKALNHNGLH